MVESAQRLPSPYRLEADVVMRQLKALRPALDWADAARMAGVWVDAVRRHPAPFWALESLLKEYPLSTAQGLAMMRLAEALLRVPDADTAIALTADQLGRAQSGDGTGHGALARLSHNAMALSRKLLPDAQHASGLLGGLGAKTVVAAALRAVQLLGRQFVLGQDIGQAQHEAAAARRSHAQLRFSYDMLGEGARTERDAQRYLTSHQRAIQAIAGAARADALVEQNDGISIKLSALHPRYEDGQRQRVLTELVPRVWTLCELAARANVSLTVDAEEVDRLELSLDVFEALATQVAQRHPQWRGFGLALQAYQTRAPELVAHVTLLARRHGLRLMCRLVKGAYWDAEIKRAQELGLPHYPVFTHKQHTDICYLACARSLLEAADVIYAQFGTHNAGTIAAILQMAVEAGGAFELQRLHGMGEGIYSQVLAQAPVACRVYAPVGRHRDLLAYLVRRLLENGANSSFVHQLADTAVPLQQLLASPLQLNTRSSLPLPVDLYGPQRRNSVGLDLTVAQMRAPLLAAHAAARVQGLPVVPDVDAQRTVQAVRHAQEAWPAWRATPVTRRAQILRSAADAMEQQLPRLCALLVMEASKTWGDCVAEVREAVDFLRYYANEAERIMRPIDLPGPTGERNELRLVPRGAWVCISPWNFPLAIFTGQIAAALVTGNTVLAKPAEQTPAVAAEAVTLLHGAGVPLQVLQLLPGPGETVGAALVAQPGIAGVVFTGSTQVAKTIQRTLGAGDGPIVPLIAETGGINAMLVDSSALPEQVVDAVLQSALRSAGQRCSALRLLCVHEEIAEAVIEMMAGAMSELSCGDPALLSTDVGPLIDEQAYQGIHTHLRRLRAQARPVMLARDHTPQADGCSDAQPRWLVAPQAFELGGIAELTQEIFGPVLHIVRWRGDPMAVIEQINALGWGLTLGLQTRIDSRAQLLADAAHVGNVYVNRNMIGAVVGVQPFGGEGLSGTGPKAGGPHYLQRFCTEHTLCVNTAAAGGNATLLA